MSLLLISVFLLGAVLGMRFKVLVLIPAVGFILISIAIGGVVHGDAVSVMLIAAVLGLGCLQLGYLCGAVARYSMVLARAQRLRKVTLQVQSAR